MKSEIKLLCSDKIWPNRKLTRLRSNMSEEIIETWKLRNWLLQSVIYQLFSTQKKSQIFSLVIRKKNMTLSQIWTSSTQSSVMYKCLYLRNYVSWDPEIWSTLKDEFILKRYIQSMVRVGQSIESFLQFSATIWNQRFQFFPGFDVFILKTNKFRKQFYIIASSLRVLLKSKRFLMYFWNVYSSSAAILRRAVHPCSLYYIGSFR